MNEKKEGINNPSEQTAQFESISNHLMSAEEYSRIKHESPYVYEIAGAEKALTYFGAGHSHDPKDPMFDTLEKKFPSAKPDIVFIEGWRGVKNMPTEYFKDKTKEEIIIQDGDPGFTASLAIKNGIELDS